MWRVRRRRLYRRFISRRDTIGPRQEAEQKTVPVQPENRIILDNGAEQPLTGFMKHMSGYIGKTVTVFVKGGGITGSGFTGILMRVSNAYIQLIIRAGPAPACSLGNSCSHTVFNPFFNCVHNSPFSYGNGVIGTVGTVAYIPADKIASFVHSSC